MVNDSRDSNPAIEAANALLDHRHDQWYTRAVFAPRKNHPDRVVVSGHLLPKIEILPDFTFECRAHSIRFGPEFHEVLGRYGFKCQRRPLDYKD